VRRKRHGRFRKEIKRSTADDFERSLRLFIEATDTKPEAFKPAGLPHFAALEHRAKLYPDFGEAFAAARRARISQLCDSGLRWNAYTEQQFDQGLKGLYRWDGQLIDYRPTGIPGYSGMQARSKRDKAFARKFLKCKRARIERLCRIGKFNRDEVFERLLAEVRAGAFIGDVVARDDMPGVDLLSKYRSENPAFARRLDEAKAIARAQRRKSRPARPEELPTFQLKGKLLELELYKVANACVPEQQRDRDDIMADLIEAVCAGEFDLEDMPRYVGVFITEHRLRAGGDDFSLDDPIGDDGGETFVSGVTTNEMHYAD
jgi:hypothetical protein